jgi:hypothetical protein
MELNNMGTPAMQAIANIALGTSASTITFTNIPSTYRDLRLVVSKTLTAQANTYIRFNGDSGSNYYVVGMGINWQPVASSFNASADTSIADHWGYASTPQGSTTYMDILDYAAIDKHKTALGRFNGMTTDGQWGIDSIAARWANSSAITSITMSLSSGQFASGSTFILYGVIA